MSNLFSTIMDLALGAAAFKLAWSVDRAQKQMVQVQKQQAEILLELTHRVERLESKS